MFFAFVCGDKWC